MSTQVDEEVSVREAHRPRASILGAAAALLLVLTALFSVRQQSAPATVPAGAPPTEFSSGRAMAQLKAISRRPHPMGSAEHAAVREQLIGELRALGLEPEVQTATVVAQRSAPPYNAGTVRNVLARLGGTAGGRAVLLVSHYDSVPTSYGASDDGTGVAAMLETARALKAGPPLKDDVLLLFTDGEEEGSLGARAFADEHPWARDVGVALNFEARGNTGPSIMFETSAGNGRLVRELAETAPHPVANSLSYEIYKRLPNDTDLTILKSAGLSGLNFAFIDGVSHYHTLLDNFQEADERSLQHQGSYALSLTRHLGNEDLSRIREADAVYFNVPGGALVHYPQTWALPLTLVVALLFVCVLAWGLRRRRIKAVGVAGGFSWLIACVVVAALAVTAVSWLVRALQAALGITAQAYTYNGGLYLAGFLCLTLAVVSASLVLFRRRFEAEDLAAGALTWWLLLAAASSLLTPGASYLFAWPLLFSAVGLALAVRESEPSKAALILCLFAVPAVVLWAPTLYFIYVALTISGATVVVAAAALLAGPLAAQFGLLTAGRRWLLPGLALLCGLGLIAVGLAWSGFDREHPRKDSVFYAMNADTGKAVWASLDQQADEWTSQFFAGRAERGTLSEIFPSNPNSFLKAAAPAAPLAPPQVSALEDGRDGEGHRIIRLRVTSPRQAPFLFVTADAPIFAASVNGKSVGADGGARATDSGAQWGLQYHAPPAEGIELTLATSSSQPLKLSVEERS
ncbi:MAG: M20/M25/M40 family metallo-hydrolase, partial [Acidobacteriota bacterium]|nr:M20/M25/M40 family metallo-hydrolase [Acidobacteriota bacterium]